MADIKFGTDGWRAVSGEDFTPENVARVIQAFCECEKAAKGGIVYVGYDRRRDSHESARLVARVLAANGFSARLATAFCPTPCISWLVKRHQALAGVMITASHNPAAWNGVKFKEGRTGCAAPPEYTDRIAACLPPGDGRATRGLRKFESLVAAGRIQKFDPRAEYVAHLRSFVRRDLIAKAGLRIVVDPLFGAGTGFIRDVLETSGRVAVPGRATVPRGMAVASETTAPSGMPVSSGTSVPSLRVTSISEIHDAADPAFGGLNPEPIERNLSALQDAVIASHADIGLATDGDADRIGAIDENGVYINSHQIFALLLNHHVEFRQLKGAVVKSVSTTQMIDRICHKHALEVIETAIGFRHICKELVTRNGLMGGEESGGISLREHVHERDGVLNGLFLLEMMAASGKKISQLIAKLEAEFGAFRFARDDYHLDANAMARVQAALAKPFPVVGGIAVAHVNTLDGTKVFFADDSWLLVRASGTEPLLRVYAEALSDARLAQLRAFAKTHLRLFV